MAEIFEFSYTYNVCSHVSCGLVCSTPVGRFAFDPKARKAHVYQVTTSKSQAPQTRKYEHFKQKQLKCFEYSKETKLAKYVCVEVIKVARFIYDCSHSKELHFNIGGSVV